MKIREIEEEFREQDVYDSFDELEENDELTASEAAFMRGYDSALEEVIGD